jgi:hypothetical protein
MATDSEHAENVGHLPTVPPQFLHAQNKVFDEVGLFFFLHWQIVQKLQNPFFLSWMQFTRYNEPEDSFQNPIAPF